MIKVFQSLARDAAIQAAYLEWLESHPNGYVLNCIPRPPEQNYPLLHNASCWTIGREAKVFAGASYKACSSNKRDLIKWAKEQSNEAKSACVWCLRRTGLTLA